MEMVILQSITQLFLAPRGHWFVKSVFDEIKYVVRVFIFGKQDKNRQQVDKRKTRTLCSYLPRGDSPVFTLLIQDTRK